MDSIENRFLRAMKRAYEMYLLHGPRSNEKIKVLHGWIQDELRNILASDYQILGLSRMSRSEEAVKGMYYPKNVDVIVKRSGLEIGVISLKFVNSNFKQNANNYFEQQMGETANLRRNDIVFGHIMCLTEPVPYYGRDGSLKKTESIRDADVRKYLALSKDHLYPHAPDVQAFCVAALDLEAREISRLCAKEDLRGLSDESFQALQTQLNIGRFFRVFTSAVNLNYQKRGMRDEKEARC